MKKAIVLLFIGVTSVCTGKIIAAESDKKIGHIAPITFLLSERVDSTFTKDNSHTLMLQSLGISTKVGQRTTPDRLPLSDTFNPLGDRVTPDNEQHKLFYSGSIMAGVSGMGYRNSYLLDKLVESSTLLLAAPAAESPEEGMRVATAGDVDGDGLEEVIMTYAMTSNHQNFSDTTLRIIQDSEEYYTVSEKQLALEEGAIVWDLKAGDVDFDGKDEIVLLIDPDYSRPDSNFNWGSANNRLLILDDQQHGFRQLAELDEQVFFADLAVADLNNNGAAEIVAVRSHGHGSMVYIFHDGLSGYRLLKQLTALVDCENGLFFESEEICKDQWPIRDAARLSIGDFDGDRLKEIAVRGTKYTGFIEDYKGIAVTPTGLQQKGGYTFIKALGPGADWDEPFARVDLNGDYVDELLSNDVTYQLNTPWSDTETVKLQFEGSLNDDSLIKEWEGLESHVAVGDFDGDSQEEIVFLKYRYDSTLDMNVCAQVIAVENVLGPQNPDVQMALMQAYDIPPGFQHRVGDHALTAAFVDHDGYIIKYRDEHEVLFTDPIIYAVLASPPYYASGIQQTDFGQTTLGYESGTELEVVKTNGVSHSEFLGLSGEVGKKFKFEWRAQVVVGGQFNWIHGDSTTTVYGQAYHTSSGKDIVLFQSTPYDVYYYTVLASPDPEEADTTVAVSIPRPARMSQTEVSYYNGHNGDNPDIQLKHTLGDPLSYYTFQEAESLVSQGTNFGLIVDNPEHLTHVAQAGENTQTVSYTHANISGKSGEFDLTIETEFRIGVEKVGLVFGGAYGYHWSWERTTTHSDTTFIEGTLCSYPEHFLADKAYQWGIFSYERTESNGNTYPVVTYIFQEKDE